MPGSSFKVVLVQAVHENEGSFHELPMVSQTIQLTFLACLQEENKILDKMHRQKVAEVEKLMQTVRELEEAVLAGGAAANAVRDYQRKVQEMNVMTTTF
jgi:hypothetical protein